MTAYFAFGLTSFLWIAENFAAIRFPFSDVDFRIYTLPMFLLAYALFVWESLQLLFFARVSTLLLQLLCL